MTTSDSWPNVYVGQFASLLNGFAFPSEGFTDNGGMPLIRIRDLWNQTTEINYRGRFDEKYVVHRGDLLIGMDGDFDTVKWKGDDALLNQRVCKLESKNPDKLVQDFLFYRVIGEVIRINRITAATTVKHLSSGDVLGIRIELPPKPEQSKIAEILLTLDRAIEQTEALIAKQQRIKTGLMQDLLTKGIDAHGNIRSESTHAFKDSPLGRIPVEWSYRTIGNSAVVCNNLRKPLSAQVRESMQGEYPYYGPTGVLDFIDEFRVNGKYVLLGEDGDHFLKFNKQEMTILINGPCNVNNHAHILKGNDEVLTDWLHFYFLHRDITYFLTRQGAGRFKLNKATLLDLPLAAPRSIGEQERICEVIEKFRVGQSETLGQRHKFQSLRVGLLADLLSGRKRVTNLLAQVATQ